MSNPPQGDQLDLADDFSPDRYVIERRRDECAWYRLTIFITSDRNTGLITRTEALLDLLPGSGIQLDVLTDQVEAMGVDELVYRLDHLDEFEAACKKRRKNLEKQLEKVLGNQKLVEGREKAAWWAHSKPSLAYGTKVPKKEEEDASTCD